MGPDYAQIFESLRDHVMNRLLEVRGSIDHAYTKIPEPIIREHFDLVLDKMYTFLATQDSSVYARFIRRYMAMRVGEGFTHENLIHSAVAIGDVVAQVARERLPESPRRDTFVRTVMRMNFVIARMMVAVVAEDLAERTSQLDLVTRGLA